MKKKLSICLLILLTAVTFCFAESQWWEGKKIGTFELNGIATVSDSDINDILYPYKGKEANASLVSEMAYKLSRVKGVATVETSATTSAETGDLVLIFKFTELPKFGKITFDGNVKIKDSALNEAVTQISEGDYINLDNKALFSELTNSILQVYANKGFGTVPVTYETSTDENGFINIVFTITEGVQTRVSEIVFAGNDNVSNSSLKKVISTHKKSMFNSGYLNEETVISDAQALCTYYQSLGYLDVVVSYATEDLPIKKEGFQDVKLTFTINEGKVWNFGGMNITGNTLFTIGEISSSFSSVAGEVLNMSKVEADYTRIQDIYYNNGYITTPISIEEKRNESDMTVSFDVKITEGPQSYVERIEIEGLEKTKDRILRRELSIQEGDVFSKESLITSLQNLYNTGLLEDVNYDIAFGNTDNGVILTFIVKEGSHMNIQFGATFGGNVTGFPVSGFLQWSDTNLGGTARQVDISTTLSPDSQSVSLAFGDKWFRNVRWANNFNFSFSHSKYEDEPQKGVGAGNYNTSNYEDTAFPRPYESFAKWQESGFAMPTSDLMDYQLYTLGLGYSTGYTWIYNSGRLSVSGGVDVDINRAVFDDNKEPFDKKVYLYGQGWKFSNVLTLGASWDGRDYINNPTKGYVLSANYTYAGGIFGGLSNYMKASASASGYLKLFEVNVGEKTKNVMLCATSTVSTMIPQFHLDTKNWQAAKFGCSKYEMLYIDGMTMARGHESVTGLEFVLDNSLEVSYTLADNIVQAEAFISATGAKSSVKEGGLDWYYAMGAGIKLKVPGFPLGLYLVKDASNIDGHFQMNSGNIFHSEKHPNSGMKIVLAISTSLI